MIIEIDFISYDCYNSIKYHHQYQIVLNNLILLNGVLVIVAVAEDGSMQTVCGYK